MLNGVYSPFKAAHHIKMIMALRNKEMTYPTQIQIDLTNKCNHRCKYCFSKYTIGRVFDNVCVDKTTLFKLLDDAVKLGIKAFHYTGGGEPFLHSDIYEILEKTIANKLEYGMVTNGSLIDFKKSKVLKNMSWIRISLDAADAEMYSKLRGVYEFNKIIRVIEQFITQCPDTVLGVSFVINPINYSQIVDFAAMAKKLGVDNVRYSIAWTPKGWDNLDELAEVYDLLTEAKSYQSSTFKVFDLTKGRLDNFSLKDKEYSSCGYQHFTTVIGADCIVYPCCTLKYNEEASFGSIKEQSFKEIWEGERRRLWLVRDHLRDVCSKNICWMEDKNKFIGYLLEDNPRHVNFI
jgi:MoaA/NifB/PqqE/SkfB family radical SAM enzyme